MALKKWEKSIVIIVLSTFGGLVWGIMRPDPYVLPVQTIGAPAGSVGFWSFSYSSNKLNRIASGDACKETSGNSVRMDDKTMFGILPANTANLDQIPSVLCFTKGDTGNALLWNVNYKAWADVPKELLDPRALYE